MCTALLYIKKKALKRQNKGCTNGKSTSDYKLIQYVEPYTTKKSFSSDKTRVHKWKIDVGLQVELTLTPRMSQPQPSSHTNPTKPANIWGPRTTMSYHVCVGQSQAEDERFKAFFSLPIQAAIQSLPVLAKTDVRKGEQLTFVGKKIEKMAIRFKQLSAFSQAHNQL